MHAPVLLQKILAMSCADVHESRLKSLIVGVEALMTGRKLSVTGLGRSVKRASSDRYDIARMDYLIGNELLYKERKGYYKAICAQLITKGARPLVAVDWSAATMGERYQVLRAGLIVQGRAFPIYEEIHPLTSYNKPSVHKQFLEKLTECFSEEQKPIIISDAGFFGPWFKSVLENGWDYIGRVRTNMGMSADGKSWENILNLRDKATGTPKAFGKVFLTKKHQLESYLYIYKKKLKKNRIRKNAYGDKSSRSGSIKSAERERDPWILVSSLNISGNDIKNFYYHRMQIEESFRDIKSTQFGFGLRNSRSNGVPRLSNLFLIAMLATFLIWLIGRSLRASGKDRGFQANSVKDRNILSIFFLGLHAFLDHRYKFKVGDLRHALSLIRSEVVYVS